MVFSSYTFVLGFLPVVLISCLCLYRINQSALIWFFALASVVFYASWNWQLVWVLGFTVLSNYSISVRLEKWRDQREGWLLLWVGIVLNIGLLGYFKYANFF